MARNYDNIDLKFSWSGDFKINLSGDLEDTKSDVLQSLRQDLHTVCASSPGDWEIYPGIGAALSDFVGEPNTEATANAIHDRLKTAIVSTGYVAEQDLDIRIIPVHIYKLLIIIRVFVSPTPANKLEEGRIVSTQLLFDTLEQGVTFFEKVPDIIKGS